MHHRPELATALVAMAVLAACNDRTPDPVDVIVPPDPVLDPSPAFDVWTFDVVGDSIFVTAPRSGGPPAAIIAARLGERAAAEASILGADAIELIASDLDLGPPRSLPGVGIGLVRDVSWRLTVRNLRTGVDVVFPTFPAAPTGVTSPVVVPYDHVATTMSASASCQLGSNTFSAECVVEAPDEGGIFVSGNGGLDSAQQPITDGYVGPPHNFIDAEACGASDAYFGSGVESDCRPYRALPSSVPGGGSVGPVRVNYTLDQTVTQFRARVLIAGNVHDVATPINPPPGFLWSPPRDSVPETGSYVYLESAPGDHIGQGRTYHYSKADALLHASHHDGLLRVGVTGDEGWSGEFEAMEALDRLEPGFYDRLTRWPFHDSARGGLDWSGEGRVCERLGGWLAVDSIAYAADSVTHVDLRFEQLCEESGPPLRGSLRWDASDPTAPPGPVNPVPAGLWQPSVAIPPSGSFVHLESGPGDAIGGGQSYSYSDATDAITVSQDLRSLSVSVDGWSGSLVIMSSLARFEEGLYPGMRRPANPTKGWLDWSGRGRGCDTLSGWFAVDDVEYDAEARTSMTVRFEQYCDDSPEPLHGYVRWEGTWELAGGGSRVAAGAAHTCALDEEGLAHCWGANDSGQLGTGLTRWTSEPTTVLGGLQFSSIASSAEHTCAVALDGRGYCWGDNTDGQLGSGAGPNAPAPREVSGGLRFSKLTTGLAHTCGLTDAHDVYCWGEDGEGQLGTDGGSAAVPTRVPANVAFKDVSAGGNHTCAVTQGGAALCWGSNDDGELGDGTTTGSATPGPVADGSDYESMAAGSRHTCGLLTTGGVRCWGHNDGTGATSLVPTEWTQGRTVYSSLAAGTLATCGITSVAEAVCWGRLGGRSGGSWTLEGGESFVSLDVGGDHACGITTDGATACWGTNDAGQLGVGGASDTRIPSVATSDYTFDQLITGGFHTCGLTAAGEMYCWGWNTNGVALGSGNTSGGGFPTPERVSGGVAFTSATGGQAHTCALATTGQAYCWGDNSFGRLGDGTTTDSNVPVAVTGGLTFDVLAAGAVHTCGLVPSGEAYCWGGNYWGELGDGTTVDRPTPVQVVGGRQYTAIVGGGAHVCALTAGGSIECWGSNRSGELGIGSDADASSVPVPVASGLTFVSIVAGQTHTCAVTDASDTYCWGSNLAGELGDGSGTERRVPTLIPGPGFTALAAGGAAYQSGGHTCGLSSGSLWCWGLNADGQLGLGDRVDRPAPERLPAFAPVTSVSSRRNHTCALSSTGTAWCWGYNRYGQTGQGGVLKTNTPVRTLPY